ncbi:MAG: Crp/Fnr family transcriptional regulator [Verrucomicrobiales bacterium]
MKEFRLPASASQDFPPQILEVPFFANLNSRVLGELIRFCTIVECEAGECVIRQGELDNSLMFLLNGEIQIEKDGKLVAGAWKKGELLGEISHLRKTPRSATLVASSSLQCLKVRPEFLDHLPTNERDAYHAALYRHVAHVLADRLELTSRRLAHLEQKFAKVGAAV